MKKRLAGFIAVCLVFCLFGGCSIRLRPSGEYWSVFTIPDASSAVPENIDVGGDFYVKSVEIGEPSTGEILASAEFQEGRNSVECSNPNDHSKYTLEKIQDSNGRTTAVKLTSNAANEFYLKVTFYSSYGIPVADIGVMKSDDGVHSSDGAVISDPYENPELPIAGFKELKFKGSYDKGVKIRESVEKSGYSTWSARYENNEYIFDTMKDLDGRAKIEESVLKPENWMPDSDQTKGNIGRYIRSDNYTGEITFEWTYMDVPFTVKIEDARLELCEDGEDVASYTFSGTAEISLTSFSIEGTSFRLVDSQRKPFCNEDEFVIQKDPEPGVNWGYMESWTYECEYGTPFMLAVDFITGEEPADIYYVPVENLDKLDGTYQMNFMMPAYGGTATWTFKPDTDK